ncbi:hypothetical protein PG985_009337 [Apiospora marii]|uniref:BTB domain-containing protein n=1 Tax=Apiospora marii TaxID=335849 RepID=A0ABR1RAE9_9PEZI
MAQVGGLTVTKQGFQATEHIFNPSFLSSGTFTFFIGPQRKEYVVYKAAFANLSPMLTAIMNNAAETGLVVFDSIEENVFETLCEYAYTGFLRYGPYNLDSSTEDQQSPATVEDGQRASVVHADSEVPPTLRDQIKTAFLTGCNTEVHCSSCGRKKCEMPPCLQYSVFYHIFCEYEEVANKPRFIHAPVANQNMNYSNALLYYAKLYMLSHRFKIKGLKILACRCIHTVLVSLPLVQRRIPDLIPLIELVYSDLKYGDLLRRMVATFTAAIKEKLMEHPKFKNLLQEQQAFCYEVLEICAEYSRAEKELRHPD